MRELTDMLYLLLVPTTVLMLLQLRWIYLQRKHDHVLFPICQLRGDLMKLLIQEWGAGRLTRDDYVYGRMILQSLNTTVSMYDQHRKRIFNIYELVRFLHRYRASITVVKVKRTEHVALRGMEKRLQEAMLRGFVAYTPFLRSKVVFRLFLALLAFLARMGGTWFGRNLAATQEAFQAVRDQVQLLGGHNGPRMHPA